MEEIQEGKFVFWESKGKMSILLKNNNRFSKYTLIPKDKKYLIVWARSKDKWSSLDYYQEKKGINSNIKGKYSLFKDNNKHVLKLGKDFFILPHGLPKDKPLIALKTEKPLKITKFRQMKLIDIG